MQIGFTLQPDQEFIELVAPLLEREADYFEIAPETTWRADGAGHLIENGYWKLFLKLKSQLKKACVAHGVGFSVGTASSADRKRKKAWLARVAQDHEHFQFQWYTEHLGATSFDGASLVLPMPLLMNAVSAGVVRRNLAAMQKIILNVGVENTVVYFTLGDPLQEPIFLNQILRADNTHLLLDLHNVYTMALNFGFEPEAYLDRLDLARVIEIHLSGGSMSDGSWLASGRVFRLDSHDGAVPEDVWKIYERVLGRCPNLKGVTLERMEGTVGAGDIAVLRDELRRAKSIARKAFR